MKSRFAFSLAMTILTVSIGLAQTPDVTGVWGRPITTDAGPGGMQITLAREGASWKATLKVRLEGQEVDAPVEDLKINGSDISFSTLLDRTTVKVTGKFEGDKLTGALG